MTRGSKEPDRFRDERRRILRRAALFTYGTFLAAVLVAVIGAAVVAWILSFAGLPFRETWLVLIVIILGAPLIARIVLALRGKGEEPPEGGPGEDERG